MKYKVQRPISPENNKFKVYFDENTGKILSITNKNVEDLDNFFYTSSRNVEEFLIGNKSITKNKVIFDIKSQEYKIISNQEILVLNIDDQLFKIKQLSDAQIIITQNIKEKKWQISASPETKEKMKDITSRLEEFISFSITEKNNPNILYNYYRTPIKEIIKNDTVFFNFSSEFENSFDNVSVYTDKKFEKYSHGVIYD